MKRSFESSTRRQATAISASPSALLRPRCPSGYPKTALDPQSELLAEIAQVCATTSPSTFASLVSRGLSAAAKALEEQQRDDLSSLVVALAAGIAMVQRRGGAKPGDKTFLDALVPALEAARTATSLTQALSLMRIAAIAGTEQMVPAIPQHGRRGLGRRTSPRHS